MKKFGLLLLLIGLIGVGFSFSIKSLIGFFVFIISVILFVIGIFSISKAKKRGNSLHSR